MPNGVKKTERDPTNPELASAVRGTTRGPQLLKVRDPAPPRKTSDAASRGKRGGT